MFYKKKYSFEKKSVNEVESMIIERQIGRGCRSIIMDEKKQHKKQIPIMKNGKVNPELHIWFNNPTKADIVGVDDVPKDEIIEKRYGRKLTKSERKILSEVRKENNKRNKNELIKDLSGNEEIIPLKDWHKWSKNKNKYDIQGVDTIPESMTANVSNKIRQKFIPQIQRQRYSGMSSNTFGYFAFGETPKLKKERNYIRINKILKGSPKADITQTHEIGHAYDYNFEGNKKFSNPKKSTLQEMKNVAFDFKPIPENAGAKFKNYRNSKEEVFADAFTSLVHNPKHVKKNYPGYFKTMKNKNPDLLNTIKKERTNFLKKYVDKFKQY